MKPIENYDFICKSLTEDGIEEKLVWIPLEDIENHEVYPKFFKDGTLIPNNGLLHIVDIRY